VTRKRKVRLFEAFAKCWLAMTAGLGVGICYRSSVERCVDSFLFGLGVAMTGAVFLAILIHTPIPVEDDE
jgi:hypothetical protein